jgi:GTP-binding protein
MQQFVDETFIEVSSGDGGSGCVSMRREKYVPKGGPDGGDGGKGGDVVFIVKSNLKTLYELKTKHFFRAKNGQPGMGRKKHGKNGLDVIIPVPPGTYIRDYDTGALLKDLTTEGEEWVILNGGKGGLGNAHFATSRKQTPRYAQPGLPGNTLKLKIELHIIADIGFVGFPNAGKSSLLSVLTNAHPKIADYPFTTKTPNLGVMHAGYRDLILADIPGILEGASHGVGLGFKFLRHISRTNGLAFLIDINEPEFTKHFNTLIKELDNFLPELTKKSRIVIGTKMDLSLNGEELEELRKALPNEKVIGISSFSRKGLDQLVKEFNQLVG